METNNTEMKLTFNINYFDQTSALSVDLAFKVIFGSRSLFTLVNFAESPVFLPRDTLPPFAFVQTLFNVKLPCLLVVIVTSHSSVAIVWIVDADWVPVAGWVFEFFYLVTQFMQSWSDNKPLVIRSSMYMHLPRKKATSHIQILHTDLFSIPAASDVGNRCWFIKFVFFLNFRKNDFIAQAVGNMVELFCSKVTHVIASYWHFLPVVGFFHKLHVLQ